MASSNDTTSTRKDTCRWLRVMVEEYTSNNREASSAVWSGLRKQTQTPRLATGHCSSEPHDVVAAIDVDDLASDAAACVRCEEDSSRSYFFDFYSPAEGSALFVLAQHIAEARYSTGGERLDRAG